MSSAQPEHTTQCQVSLDADLPLMKDGVDTVPLFWPYITEKMRVSVYEQMQTRWLGQGPAVDAFEERFQSVTLDHSHSALAVNSGTSALHLAYLTAMERYWPTSPGQRLDGEVICPVFTCTATNIPWRYMGLDIVWADIDIESMNVDVHTIESLITDRTRAITVVHYGGFPVDMVAIHEVAGKRGIPVIEDAAQALGAYVDGKPVGTLSDYTAFSFQAIKHITTGDGGMLALASPEDRTLCKRLRWFGIDREGKQNGTWENDIWELGFKYQMTDVAARMGLAGIDDLDQILSTRRRLLARYESNLANCEGVRLLVVPPEKKNRLGHAAWLATIVVDEGRSRIRDTLRTAGIESNAVHFRNDRYSLFADCRSEGLPNMDAVEDKYLCLPLHTNMSEADVDRASDIVIETLA